LAGDISIDSQTRYYILISLSYKVTKVLLIRDIPVYFPPSIGIYRLRRQMGILATLKSLSRTTGYA